MFGTTSLVLIVVVQSALAPCSSGSSSSAVPLTAIFWGLVWNMDRLVDSARGTERNHLYDNLQPLHPK